jgi:glycosyltransferase involved in cell wall biosynthesis
MQQPSTSKQAIAVSIIVPVYNVEPYLRRCLDSLINQTLKGIEVICINDCSPDNSLAILKEYAKEDDRIKIIDFEKNQGVNAARNSGMKIAKGEYIGFCDPDDYVDLDFYEKLYKLAKDKDVDISWGNSKFLDWNAKSEIIMPGNSRQYSKYERFSNTVFWSGIYRKSMLRKYYVKFPTTNVINGGDRVFKHYAIIVAKKYCFMNSSYYHYIRRTDGSLDSKIMSRGKIQSVLFCFALILNRLNISKISKSHYCCVYKNIFLSSIWFLPRASSAYAFKETAKFLIKYYKKCKFRLNLKLPRSILHSIKKENETELVNGLKLWLECDYYPPIHISKTALQKRKLCVWGTGQDSSHVIHQCKHNGWEITAFLDSSKNVKEFNGYKAKRPKSILNKKEKDFFIIISSRKYAKEIAEICEKAGLREGLDFWRPR